MLWLLALSLLGADSADLTRDSSREQQEIVVPMGAEVAEGVVGIPPNLAPEGVRGIPPGRLEGVRGIPPSLAEGVRGIPPGLTPEGVRGIPPGRLEGVRGIPPGRVA
jgi:hypothetical protein